MRIAMSLLSGASYGGRTYFSRLIPELARVDRTNEYHFFVPKGHELARAVRAPNIIFHECMAEQQSVLRRFLWEQLVLPFELHRHRIDVLYTAKNLNCFFAPCKTVIAIRNIQPFFYQQFAHHWRLRLLSWLIYRLTRRSMVAADAIVAVSRSVQEHIEHSFPKARGKTVLVYNGNPVPESYRSQERDANAEGSYFLTASKFVAYANQLNLVRGYALLRARRTDVPPLWFAGGVYEPAYFARVLRAVAANGLTEHVRFLGFLPQEELFALYRNARAFLFPSTLECCPHTLIEAMACGAPVATTTIPPMPEICGDVAVYFDAYNPVEIAHRMEELLDDRAMREDLRARGFARAGDFTWEHTARSMVEVFRGVVAAG